MQLASVASVLIPAASATETAATSAASETPIRYPLLTRQELVALYHDNFHGYIDEGEEQVTPPPNPIRLVFS